MSHKKETKTIRKTWFTSIALFFSLTFVISWGWTLLVYFLPDVYYAQNYYSIIGILATLFIGINAFGPTIAAIIGTSYFEGKTGLKEYVKSLTKFKVKYHWYLLVFLIPISAYALPIIFNLAIGNLSDSDYFNTNLWGLSFATVASSLFFAAIAEEPGWRGYALPKMNERLRPIISGIIIGVIWAFWHLLFYVSGTRDWATFPQFVFTVTIISCIYTWIYMKTKSIPLMVIFHLMHNLSNTVFINYHNPIWGGLAYFVMLIVILLFDSGTLLSKSKVYSEIQKRNS